MPRYAQKAEADKTQAGGNTQQLFNAVNTEAQAIPTDYTEEQKATLRQLRLGTLDDERGLTEDRLMRFQGATGSTTGMPELIAEMGRETGREKSRASNELEAQLFDVPVQRRLMRANIYGGMYGPTAGLYGNLASTSASANRNNTLGMILGAGGGALGAAAGCWVADALYGVGSPKALLLRYWMPRHLVNRTWGDRFYRLYLQHGERWAMAVRASRVVRFMARIMFDRLHVLACKEA